MTTKNDVTGDLIQTKHTSNVYRANWDKIFKKKAVKFRKPKADKTQGNDSP